MKAAKSDPNQQITYPHHSSKKENQVSKSPNQYDYQYQYENQNYENFVPMKGSPGRGIEPYYPSNQFYPQNVYSNIPYQRNYENAIIDPYSGSSPPRIYDVPSHGYQKSNYYTVDLQPKTYNLPPSIYPAAQYFSGASPQRIYNYPPSHYTIPNYSHEPTVLPQETQGYYPSKAYTAENNF